MTRLTIAQAAAKPNCPWSEATLRDMMSKKKLRRILNPDGEGEYIKYGENDSSPVRIIEERFDLFIHKMTYPGSEAETRGVPLSRKRKRA